MLLNNFSIYYIIPHNLVKVTFQYSINLEAGKCVSNELLDKKKLPALKKESASVMSFKIKKLSALFTSV